MQKGFDWTTMTSEEAYALRDFMEQAFDEFKITSTRILNTILDVDNDSGGETQREYSERMARILCAMLEDRYHNVSEALLAALHNRETEWKPYDAKDFWSGKVGIRRLDPRPNTRPTGSDIALDPDVAVAANNKTRPQA